MFKNIYVYEKGFLDLKRCLWSIATQNRVITPIIIGNESDEISIFWNRIGIGKCEFSKESSIPEIHMGIDGRVIIDSPKTCSRMINEFFDRQCQIRAEVFEIGTAKNMLNECGSNFVLGSELWKKTIGMSREMPYDCEDFQILEKPAFGICCGSKSVSYLKTRCHIQC